MRVSIFAAFVVGENSVTAQGFLQVLTVGGIHIQPQVSNACM